ncbi:O-antigen polymerase [Ferrimonas balearica DSM 9799]|uniref:O-antigen polymerase n=1 Tax=Ferrimonas balearica (strain DSM 9799 / CCM 4581 / KCTC 23876 / PAT) TaxID=550540 RepID=E1SN72_FERBD|nr:Wzy polymerase domain-containing protein [Ferrimonas balearica]ADN74571.1 O-antigen polymerase [Ferrimonas balearica DSM 9799]
MMTMTREGQLNRWYLGAWGLLWLLAMHYYQPNGGGSGLSLAFNTTSWMALALVLAVGAYQAARRGCLRFNALLPVSTLCLLALCLPLLWSPAPWAGTALPRYLGLFALLALLLCQQQMSLRPQQQRLFWRLVIAAGLIQTLFSLIQFLSPTWFPALMTSQRPVGIFQQTNLVATFIGATMAISYYRLQQETSQGWRRLSWLLILLGATAQWLIQSRTGVVGTTLALLGLSALLGWHLSKRLWALLVVGVVLGAALQALNQAPPRDNLEQPGYRTTLYGLSAELIAEHPWQGVGIGQFQPAFMEKQAQHQAGAGDYPYWSTASSHPHNELLFWGVEGGLLPMVAILMFGLWVTYRVWRAGRLRHKALWLCLLPVLLHSQTEYPLYQSAPHLALFAVLVAAMVPGRWRRLTLRGEGVLRLSAPIMVVLVWAFMLTNLHTTYVAGQYYATKQPHYLVEIVNPFGQTRNINYLTTQALLRVGSPTALAQAEQLAHEEARLRPTIGSYALWQDSLWAQGRYDEAEQVRQRGQYLFRDQPKFQRAVTAPPTTSQSAARSLPASAAAPAH